MKTPTGEHASNENAINVMIETAAGPPSHWIVCFGALLPDAPQALPHLESRGGRVLKAKYEETENGLI